MHNTFILEYFQYQACLNIEQGINIWHLLNSVVSIHGAVAEFGCLSGMTATLLRRTLDDQNSSKRLILYDSFEGLLPPTKEDGENFPLIPENFKVDPAVILENFDKQGLKYPDQIVKGWFSELDPGSIPSFSFVHLDADTYQSTLDGLKLIYPKLSQGAVLVIDDYSDPEACNWMAEWYNINPYRRHKAPIDVPSRFPGVKLACDEFFKDKPEDVEILLADCECHGYLRKR